MRKRPLTGTLSFLSYFNHLSSASSVSLRLGFSSHFILDLFCSDTPIILFPFFQIYLTVEFTRPNSPNTSAFFFPFPISRSYLTFPSILKTSLLFVTITITSLYQSPVNCRCRKVEGNIQHSHCYYCHFPGVEFM
jgi:hypothetical protein